MSVLQGTAYMLLEQYSEAESTLLEGLAEDPTHIGLQNALRQAAAASAEALVRSPMARYSPLYSVSASP